MNETYKKKASSFPAGRFTKEDIQALKNYLDELEALQSEPVKGMLTAEEWNDAMNEISLTGKIPKRYEGRIAETETANIREAGISYYDIAENDHDKKISRLTAKYHDSLVKAILNDPWEGGGFRSVTDIIREFIEDPAIIRELEKEAKAAQKNALAPLGSVPNGDSLNWLYRVLSSSKGGRMVTESSGNRREEITAQQYGDKMRFTRTNKQNGSTVIVEIDQADKYLRKTNKTFTKILLFALQKMTAQNNPLEVGFSLQELVDLGMYYDTSTARRAVKEFFSQQKLTTLSGIVKKGKKTVKEEGGILFYHYKINNGFVTLSVNENFNLDFIANYFTVFPRFAYALSNNAFSLVRYIFFIARQNTQAIKNKGKFTISLENIRENLGLPSSDEVNNRKYRQFIIEPIEKAIEEVEEALLKVPEAKEYGFTITPCGTDTSNIREWLQGYLEIGLNGDFAETFIRLATKAEKDRTHWERIKQAELAKIAAHAEAKETQDAQPKRTGGRQKRT